MQQARMGYQRMVSGVKRVQAAVRRGGGVGVLAGLLLLPLGVGAVGSGDLDPSFGGDGRVLTDFGSGSYDGAYAVAIQPDGKIVVAGDSYGEFGGPAFALARYLPNGTLDTSFGGDGRVLTDFGSIGAEAAYALAIQADGKVVVAGYSELSDRGAFALARYLPNGTLDTSFGGDGRVLTDFGSGSAAFVFGLAIQPDGKIVVAGMSTASGSYDFALARYLPNGTLDPSFGSDGTVLTDFGSGSAAFVFGLAIQPDGKIVVAGMSTASGSYDFALARYLPNGTLDPSFGSDGTVLTDFGSGSRDWAYALALQSDGKIVVAGYSDGAFALARYLPNGTLDATFSGDGRVATSFGSGRGGIAYALALQSDGKIVVAGGAYVGSPDMALARYLPNGTLDPSFSGDGRVITSFESGSDSLALALALQPNGKIVVAGFSDGGFALARYLPNGTLDTTFNGDGKVTTAFGSSGSANALAIQPRDGRLVVAGSSLDGGGQHFALARYHAITCNGVVATRVGTAGNDTLMGTNGPDVIVGFDGDDTIYGLGGNDLLCGNAGNDTLVGGTGDDTLVGDTGTDVCNGGTHVQKDTASGCEYVTGVP